MEGYKQKEDSEYYIAEDGEIYPTKSSKQLGIWIPEELAIRNELTWEEKILIRRIESLCNTPNGCFASNAYFAQIAKCSVHSIIKYFSHLRKMRILKTVSFNGRKRYIKIDKKQLNTFLKTPNKILSCIIKNTKLHNKKALASNIKANILLSKDNSMRFKKNNLNKSSILFSNENKSKALKKPAAFSQSLISNQNQNQNEIKNNLLKKNTFSEKIITLWSKQQNVSKHKKETILKKIRDLINCLRKGTFKKKHHLDKRFLKDFNIPEKLLSKKFSKEEIKQTILRMAQCHLSEYTPADKTFISRSLVDMIYHLPFKGRGRYNSTSWFFSCFVKAPELIEEQMPELSKQEKLLLETFREEIRDRKINELKNISEKDLSSYLIKFHIFWKKKIIDENNKPKNIDFSENKYFRNSLISNKFGTSCDMLRAYLDWLEENDWINRGSYLFDAKNSHFQNFLKYEGNELNYDLTGNLELTNDN